MVMISNTFQSTLPREERRRCSSISMSKSKFQSTLPREERLFTIPNYIFKKIYFNPRSHERSDGQPQKAKRTTMISIHAPTRGATKRSQTGQRMRYNFNPRSHERSDTASDVSNTAYGDFNPRSHERSDGGNLNLQQGNKISIHAPTRGATV